MGSSDKIPRPAYVVDVDEASGKAVSGSRRSASTRDKPKASHRDSRSGKTRKSHSDTGPTEEQVSAEAQNVQIVKREKEGKLERRKSVSGSTKSPHKSSRPPSSHENRSFPKLSIPGGKSKKDDPSHFGIPTPTYAPTYTPTYTPTYRPQPVVSQPMPIRPRATTTQTYPRPQSFHQSYATPGGYYPPPSMSSYYQQPPVITPSYPPPSPSSSYMRYAATPQPPSQSDYFGSQHITAPIRPLSARFDAVPRTHSSPLEPIARTASAFGSRDVLRQTIADSNDAGYYEDSYASAEGSTVRRRESIRKPSGLSKAESDYISMPPPPPPQRETRPAGILRWPTIDSSIDPLDNGTGYRDRDHSRERDAKPRYRDDPSPRRPSANRNSVSYDLGKDSDRVRVETANNGRRRQSYYGQSASTGSSGYEDKLHQATSYQEDVAGPTVPLTADMLRKQQRRQAGSSRSTRSSGSRDESDYRKSATTRTTRSGSGNDDENVTIKVTGQARVMVGGAQIDCNQGGEIEIKRSQGQRAIRNGSERSHSEYEGGQIEDRRSRVDRPTGRSRMSSQHSYTRSTPHYPMDNYI
jgi:hypothetical protein